VNRCKQQRERGCKRLERERSRNRETGAGLRGREGDRRVERRGRTSGSVNTAHEQQHKRASKDFERERERERAREREGGRTQTSVDGCHHEGGGMRGRGI
jgi:hypothetical protein